MIQGTRTFRTPAVLGMRQQVSAVEEPLSVHLIRSMAVILLIAITAVFAVSEFMHWRIGGAQATLAQLQSVRREVGSESISLLAARARLMSNDHVAAIAAARLQLYRPEAGQLHRL